ncbi:hypothetical protein LNQ03_06260 [Klebsiella pneumoniae subsp. pneumoniae]|nr:hypothetical protein [Klebsiella pneumoniae subsp. pneumoniae]
MLEYARETLTAADIEVCHSASAELCPGRPPVRSVLTTRRCRRSMNSWPGLMAPIIATPVYKASFSGALENAARPAA